MNTHRLKTWLDQFQAIVDGKKRHEFRQNDRDFKVGDELCLQEYDQVNRAYTGREIWVHVSYIGHPGEFGIPGGYCVMSIQPKDGCSR